jgi:drug/metabolite transporter (DMT)-like permease
MNDAVLFGGAAAVLYGVTDLVARFANRENGVARTMLWGQGLLAVLLAGAVVAFGRPLPAEPLPWTALLGSSLMITAGTACLYHGLKVGRIAVVAPLMACYGAVGAVLSLMTGERLTWMAGLGLVLTVVGAVLSAIPAPDKKQKDRPSGWLPAMGSALLYGTAYWIQGKYAVPVFGALDSIWIYYLFATLVVALVARARRHDVRLAGTRDTVLIAITAVLAAAGYLALAFGQASGSVAVATALSAAASAITVLLARVFIREQVAVTGWIGVACVVAGVATLHLSVA